MKMMCGDSLKSCDQKDTKISKMPRLTDQQRGIAVGMLRARMKQREIARQLGCSQATISKLRRRFEETGSVRDRPRSGRPRVTTPNQDRWIVLQHLRDRFRPASATARVTPGLHYPRISADTVRRRLRSRHLRARRPVRGPVLGNVQRRNRLRWCRQHLRWTRQQWNGVVFSDESRFCVSMADGRQRIWRRQGERYARCCVQQFNRWGGPSVMVWTGITAHHRTPLVVIDGNLTAQRYVNNILQPHLVPFMQAHPELNIFQQDNARPHAARLTKNFLQAQGIEVLQWMPYSPDLNPIEHLWDELGRRIAASGRRPTTRPMLIQALQAEWNAIPQERIRRLVQSMRQRCQACVQAQGGHTRY